MTEVEKQFRYYLAHQEELVTKFDGRFVVIKDEKIVGDFPDEGEAYAFASGQFEAGTFVIQRVSPGEGDYSQTFHSRVAI